MSLPPSLVEFEREARGLIATQVSRGRVSAKITLHHTDGSSSHLVFDESLAQQYIAAAKSLAAESGVDSHFTAADLFRAPGVFRIDETKVKPEDLHEALQEALKLALEQFTSMQQVEGAHLRGDLQARLEAIIAHIAEIRKLAPLIAPAYRETLRNRLAESGLELDFDDERLLREIALFAERCDVTEELTRLDSHVALFVDYLASDEPMGRPLDFLCQEFNRELNTIGSKANNAEIAHQVVSAKTELEKIREQVQNVQ